MSALKIVGIRPFKQGPRNRLCRAAGAAASSGGSALHEVKSVGVNDGSR
jgi:hypothetical protein